MANKKTKTGESRETVRKRQEMERQLERTCFDNESRVKLARDTLVAFLTCSGVNPRLADFETAAADLLADLLHWCDANGIDFDKLLATARMHHHEEVEEESLQP